MNPDPTGNDGAAGSRHSFATTHWTLVLTARQPDASVARLALEQLCRTYWYPLYVYVRRRGCSQHDAEDLVQGFFARLIGKDYLADVDRKKGKFRSFLLAALNHFMADEWDRSRAQKRGGGKPVISLNADAAESRYQLEPADNLTPERIYERSWALTLLDQALARLQREYESDGKKALFDELRFCLTGEGAALAYAQMAERLHMSEGAVKVAVHRLRRRYRGVLREEIAQTLADQDDVEEELRHLFAVFAP